MCEECLIFGEHRGHRAVKREQRRWVEKSVKVTHFFLIFFFRFDVNKVKLKIVNNAGQEVGQQI